METIRFCKIEEIPLLESFINDYWVKDHILSKRRDLLSFQHRNFIEHQINYVVAYDGETKKFTSVLGFIPSFQYDQSSEIGKKPDGPIHIWLAIWCRAPHATKGVGMKLYDFLISHYKPSTVAAIGINDKIKETYKSMGYQTGKLSQYYFFRQTLNIAQPQAAEVPTVHIKKEPIEAFNQYQFLSENRPVAVPQKTDKYFRNRYKTHPIYEYLFYGAYESASNLLVDVIVIRKNKVKTDKISSSCLRIVDSYNHFKGIPNITNFLNQVLIDQNAEYIDCLNYGVPSAKFEEMGFKKRIADEIIIPNYFEPFVQKNIDIEFAYKIFSDQEINMPKFLAQYSDQHNYVIFKGDSDQDRPNLIPN